MSNERAIKPKCFINLHLGNLQKKELMETKRKCVFLDRDGVLNVDFVDYVYSVEKFIPIDGVKEALHTLKEAGYLLIVITNQSGIIKGIYDHQNVFDVHELMQDAYQIKFDDLYYSPYHQDWTNSLTRKPDTLMLERAIAKFNIDISKSWMIGDKPRDMIPAKKEGLNSIIVENGPDLNADYSKKDLLAASQLILQDC